METKTKEKTKEEILESITSKTISYLTLNFVTCTTTLIAMQIYADQQTSSLQSEISRLKAELEISQRVNYECDVCHNHPTIIYSTPKGRFCESCKPTH
jgi:hypothetical protein